MKSAKYVMPLLVTGTLVALLLPETAWANYSYPPGMKFIPPTLIILLPLVMIFTELGGGYRIIDAESSGKYKWWNKWKPILAIIAVISPAFISIEWPPTLVIVGGVIIFSFIRGLKLINYGLYKKNSENQPAWRKHARPRRLIPAGVMIICITLILSAAMAEGIAHPGQKKRAYDSDTKSNLHNIFLACKAYWSDNGSSGECSYDIATLTTYGYIQSSDVVVGGKGGNEKNFNIIAIHQNSKNAFEVNEVGTISQVAEGFESNSEKINDLRAPKEIPEEPNIFSKAWEALVDIYR